MIIDADTHIAPTGGKFVLEEHMARMERCGIDKALTWLAPFYAGTGIEEYNEYVYQAAQQYPDHILPFGWADPTVGVEHAIDMVKKCTYDYGMYGVKLNGAQNNYFIDLPAYAPVIEEIAKSGKALAFHIGSDAYEYTHPLRAAKIAQRYPEMPVLMVHMGREDPMMNNVVIEVAQQNPNMILIGSATTDKAIWNAIQALGAERVCFGTDDPFSRAHVVLAMYNALLEGEVTADEKALIMGGNIARVLGVEN